MSELFTYETYFIDPITGLPTTSFCTINLNNVIEISFLPKTTSNGIVVQEAKANILFINGCENHRSGVQAEALWQQLVDYQGKKNNASSNRP